MAKVRIRIEATEGSTRREDRRLRAIGDVDLAVTPHYQYVTDDVLVTIDLVTEQGSSLEGVVSELLSAESRLSDASDILKRATDTLGGVLRYEEGKAGSDS